MLGGDRLLQVVDLLPDVTYVGGRPGQPLAHLLQFGLFHRVDRGSN
jgi:hypothetical protein